MTYKSCAIELQPPEVPPRPPLNELKESLNDKLGSYDKQDIKIGGVVNKKRNFLISSSLKDTVMKKNYDNYKEKTFNITVYELFGSLLNTLKLLGLSPEYINAASYEIIAKDNFKNVFLIQILEDKSKTKLKIFGYAKNIFKKESLINNMNEILVSISES